MLSLLALSGMWRLFIIQNALALASSPTFKAMQKCTMECLTNTRTVPTVVPVMVKDVIFKGENCPIYPVGEKRNCEALRSAADVVMIGGKHYFLTFQELSWFGAQKFCHQGGWLLGNVSSATFEKEIASQWQGQITGMESLWSDANSIGSQGAAFFLPDTAKYQATLKLEMRNWRQVDASFIQGSELKWNTSKLVAKRENCTTKKARFFCQLPPSCPVGFDACSTADSEESESECINLDHNLNSSSPTVPPQKCQEPHCHMPAACVATKNSKDINLFDPPAPSLFGRIISSCGHKFFIARDFFPINTSIEFCCSIGMRLVSVESKAKLKCLSAAIAKTDASVLGSRWWTSATDAGCPEKMAWCGAGVPFLKREVPLVGQVDGPEQCVVLKRTGTLHAAPCDEFNRPLCEGSSNPSRIYSHQKCPRVQCNLNLAVFNPLAGAYFAPSELVPQVDGFISIRTLVSFFLSRVQMSWIDAQTKCCSIGMKLLAVKKPGHLNRLRVLMEEKVAADNTYYKKKDAPEKLTFWTAGYEWRKNQHIWCHSGEKMPNYNLWSRISSSLGIQGDEGNCVQLEIGPKMAQLHSVNCSLKQNFICESFAESSSESTCEASQCFYSGSKEEFKLFKKSNLSSRTYIAYSLTAKSISLSIVSSELRKSPVGIYDQSKTCSSLGMNLLYLENVDDLNCVFNAISELDYGSRTFYLNLPLSHYGCLERPVWCGNGRPFNMSHLLQWPSYVVDKEIAVSLCYSAYLDATNRKPKLMVFRDWCHYTTSRFRVICEIPV